MTDLSKPVPSNAGSCCGGGAATTAGPQVTGAVKSTPAPVGNSKPAASSGCCGG